MLQLATVTLRTFSFNETAAVLPQCHWWCEFAKGSRLIKFSVHSWCHACWSFEEYIQRVGRSKLVLIGKQPLHLCPVYCIKYPTMWHVKKWSFPSYVSKYCSEMFCFNNKTICIPSCFSIRVYIIYTVFWLLIGLSHECSPRDSIHAKPAVWGGGGDCGQLNGSHVDCFWAYSFFCQVSPLYTSADVSNWWHPYTLNLTPYTLPPKIDCFWGLFCFWPGEHPIHLLMFPNKWHGYYDQDYRS